MILFVHTLLADPFMMTMDKLKLTFIGVRGNLKRAGFSDEKSEKLIEGFAANFQKIMNRSPMREFMG